MEKLRKHLDVDLKVSLRAEEDGTIKVHYDLNAIQPYKFVMDTLEEVIGMALAQYKKGNKLIDK